MADTAEISCPNFPQIILKVKRPNHQILRPSQNPFPDSQNNLHARIIHQVHQLYGCCAWFVDCISSDYIAIWPEVGLKPWLDESPIPPRVESSSKPLSSCNREPFKLCQLSTSSTSPPTINIESPRGLIGSVNSLFGGYHAQEKPKLHLKTKSSKHFSLSRRVWTKLPYLRLTLWFLLV